jgi:hypothetical protein
LANGRAGGQGCQLVCEVRGLQRLAGCNGWSVMTPAEQEVNSVQDRVTAVS